MAQKQVKRRPARQKRYQLVLGITLLSVWFLTGLYFGIAGWVKLYVDELQRKAILANSAMDCSGISTGFLYNGEIYCTMEDIMVDQSVERVENLQLQWVSKLPEPLPILIAAFAFGAVGSIVRVLRMTIAAQELSSLYTLSLSPAIGGMTACMVLGLSFLLPSWFTDTKISLHSTVVPFLSLFSGAFAEYIQKGLQAKLNKIF